MLFRFASPWWLLLVPLALAAGWWLARRRRRADARMVLPAATTRARMVVSPWVVRNQVRFDEPTLMSTQDGLTLLGANCSGSYSGDGLGFWVIGCAARVDEQVPESADESVRSKFYRQEAVEFIGDNLTTTTATDATDPLLGQGFLYVLRYAHFATVTPYGWSSAGSPRASTAGDCAP